MTTAHQRLLQKTRRRLAYNMTRRLYRNGIGGGGRGVRWVNDAPKGVDEDDPAWRGSGYYLREPDVGLVFLGVDHPQAVTVIAELVREAKGLPARPTFAEVMAVISKVVGTAVPVLRMVGVPIP